MVKVAAIATPVNTLREYQETDRVAIEKAWETFRSVLYQLPTGGGKSVIIEALVSDYRNEKILIFAHKKRLITQLYNRLSKLGITVGMMQGQNISNLDANIVIASIRTAVKSHRLDVLIKTNWNRVMIDEARHCRTGSYDTVLDKILGDHPQCKLFGVDATPYRKDKKLLDKHFQTMVVSCENIKSLQAKGFLAKIRTYATPIGEIQEQVKEVANDYQQTQLSEYMRQQKYLDYVVDAYTKFGENRQAIVFAVDKAHSKDLMATFKTKGYTSVRQMDSDMEDTEIDEVYSAYESGELKILINIEMVTEGVDLPNTGCVVGARPTKSLTLYLQMGGRGMRPKEDGSDLIVIDCAGWTEEFGCLDSPREWSLDPEVDPNNPRRKNTVVGKDKNGNFTTDKDEMDEFTELVEMTPEEYIGKVQGGMKAAEKKNMSIDEKVAKIQKDLEELLHKAAVAGLKDKVSPFTTLVKKDKYDKDKLIAYFFHVSRGEAKNNEENIIDAWKDSTHVVEMYIDKREKMFASLNHEILTNSYYSRYRKDEDQSIKEYREMSQVCGQVNHMILDNKNLMMQILEKYQAIHELEKSKINLEEYRDLEKKFKKDKWIQAVNDHVAKGEEFVFATNLTMDDYFRNSGYRTRIIGFSIPSKSINFNSTLLLTLSNYHSKKDETYTEEKGFVKKEKIFELLENGNWQPAE